MGDRNFDSLGGLCLSDRIHFFRSDGKAVQYDRVSHSKNIHNNAKAFGGN